MEWVDERALVDRADELLSRVSAGESFLVADEGVPVAALVPVHLPVGDRLAATGRLRRGTGLDVARLPPPVPAEAPTAGVLDSLRGC